MRIPSKTFLLGEYAVLWGSKALVLGHGPWFETGLGATAFHEKSPAGKLLGRAASFTFLDPYQGAGGFGGSGAEFVAAFAHGKPLPRGEEERKSFAWNAWDAYQGNPGSGCDILVQSYGIDFGRDFCVSIDLRARDLAALLPEAPGMGATLSLFRTHQKLPTHEHLAKLPEMPWETMAALTAKGESAILSGDLGALASAIRGYAKELSTLGLVAAHTQRALQSLPVNVLAAKGCGAMGADVVAVLHEGAALEAWAAENLLSPVAALSV